MRLPAPPFSNKVLFDSRREDKEMRESVALLSDLPGFDDHLWIRSSATTRSSSHPEKWVALSHVALLTSAVAVNKHLRVDRSDSWLSPLPSFHVGGLGIHLRSYAAEIPCYDLYSKERWSPHSFVEALEDRQATLTSLVPAQVYDLVKANLTPFTSLRAVIVGGDRLTEALWRRARELRWPLLPSYGMTEASSQIATAPLEEIEGGRYPLPWLLPHVESRIDDKGILHIRGPSLFTCYALIKEGEVTIHDPKEEGWFNTGDIVDIVEDRLISIERERDSVKILGEKVSMAVWRELWKKITLEKGYKGDSELVAVEDPRRGTTLSLYATVEDDILTRCLEEYNSKALPFLRIDKAHVVEKLPRTPLGKLLTSQLLL